MMELHFERTALQGLRVVFLEADCVEHHSRDGVNDQQWSKRYKDEYVCGYIEMSVTNLKALQTELSLFCLMELHFLRRVFVRI